MNTTSNEASSSSPKKVGKILASYYLLVESFDLLRKNPHILILSLLSGAVSFIFVAGSLLMYVWINIQGERLPEFARTITDPKFSPPYSLYLISGFLLVLITTFFQVAIMSIVSERIDGKKLTLKGSIKRAEERGNHILEWAILSSIIATMFSLMLGLSSVGQACVLTVLYVVWIVSIFYIVPPMSLEERTLVESMRKSITAIKNIWVETITVGILFGVFVMTFSVAFILAFFFIAIFLSALLDPIQLWSLLLPSFCLFVILSLAFAVSFLGAVRTVIRVVLYTYSEQGHKMYFPQHRSEFVLSALRPKKK